jgi:hypothetical protein
MGFPTGYEQSYNVGWPSNVATTIQVSAGNRENLMDPIIILDPTDTPLVNMLPKEEWPAPYVEWLTDTLPTTATGGAPEGSDWTPYGLDGSAAAYTNRTRYANNTQIMKHEFSVSRTQIQTSQRGMTAGVRNEYQYQLFKFMKNLLRSIDARVSSNISVTGATGTSATATTRLTRVIRGFSDTGKSIIVTNVNGTFATATYGGLRAAMDAAGADPDTLFVTSPTKVAISIGVINGGLFTGGQSPATANGVLRRFTQDAFEKEISTVIDVMEDDFGRVVLIRDRWMPYTSATAANVTGASGAYFLMDRSKVKLGFFQRPDHFPLPPNGDSQRGFVLAEWGMKVLHPSAVGVGYNVTDSF